MSEPTADRDPFEVVAESFLEQYRAGHRPGVEEYAARYPELAEQIRELLPALVMVEQDFSIDRDPAAAPSRSIATSGESRRLDDYLIVREIGRGGMGVVYEAEQVSLGRRVALKVLPAHVAGDRKSMERFRREAKAAAGLHHTNIVPVFDVGRGDGVAYFAMQFIQGRGLDLIIDELARLRDDGRNGGAMSPAPTVVAATSDPREPTLGQVAERLLMGRLATEGTESPGPGDTLAPAGPAVTERLDEDAISGRVPAGASPSGFVPGRADAQRASAVLPGGTLIAATAISGHRPPFFRSVAQIGRQVAQGLAYAHARGIIHRDIKPSNLLLDHAGVVWIADFGLAKGDDDGLTSAGDVLGTLRYMAPERFRGEGDARADVYALGLTLYELLTLRPGFESSDRLKMIEQIKAEEPRRPRLVDPRIPRDLETIVLKAIDKEPDRRYPSAEAMAEDLRRFVDDEPIQARRTSTTERCARWMRHNPWITTLIALLMAVLITVAVGSTVAATYFHSLAASEAHAKQKSQEAETVAIAARKLADLERDKAQRNEKAERSARYRSNIAAASAAFQLQNADAASGALDETPTEHRNWEWQYLHSQLDDASVTLPLPGERYRSHVLSPSGRQVAVCCVDHNHVYLYAVATGKLEVVLRGHSAPVASVAYRPDGKQLATVGNDQTIRLWDPATGQQMARLKLEVAPPHQGRNPRVEYSSDGSRMVSSAPDAGTTRLWDVSTGKELAVLAKWQERRTAVAISTDGERTAALSADGQRVTVRSGEFVRLYDAVTGRQLAVLGPHEKVVSILAFSPDGRRIASACFGDSGSSIIHLWDGASGKEVAVLRGHIGIRIAVVFSPDGSRLVSWSEFPDQSPRLWDAATGRLLAVLAGHKNAVREVAFSPDGTRVVTASMDQTARLWDGRTGQSLAVLAGHTHLVIHVLFSPNGARVVTGSYDGTLRLWDAGTGDVIGVLRGLGDIVNAPPSLTPDGSRLVSGSSDGTLRIWDLSLVDRNGVLRGHESYVYDVTFSPDGAQVASVAWDGTARFWDATTGRQIGLLKHETATLNSVAYRRDGRRLATVDRGRGIAIWDLTPREPVRSSLFVIGDIADGARASFNPAGTLLAGGSTTGPVRLWDVATGREVARLGESYTTDLAFHPGGSLLAAARGDGEIGLWDVATSAPVAVLRGHTAKVWRMDFSADGKWLASCSHDKTIRFWDAQTHEPLAVIPMGTIVWGLAVSPDGTRLAAACRDTTIRLIDVASRQQVAVLRGHTDYVHAVAWSPDGTRLVSGSGDGTVRIWDSLSVPARVRASAARPANRDDPSQRR